MDIKLFRHEIGIGIILDNTHGYREVKERLGYHFTIVNRNNNMLVD